MIGAIQNSEHTSFGKIPKHKHFKYVPNFFPQIFSLANFFQIPGSGSKLGNTLVMGEGKKKTKNVEIDSAKHLNGCKVHQRKPQFFFSTKDGFFRKNSGEVKRTKH